MSGTDLIRLSHMRDSARETLGFIRQRTRADLDTDRMLALAIVKELEIIGEAAARVTPETRAAIPQLPWPEIVGMRNRLIHAYFDVNLDIVWVTATTKLPELLAALDGFLSSGPSGTR